MKYAHYDEITGKILGWYDSNIHCTESPDGIDTSNLPTPFIEVQEDIWQGAVSKGDNHIDIINLVTDSIDFRDLTEQKEDKRISIKESYIKEISKDIDYMGYKFSTIESAKLDMSFILSAGVIPEGFFWASVNDDRVPMTLDELRGLSEVIIFRNQIIFNKYLDLREDINNINTSEELELLVYSCTGCPSILISSDRQIIVSSDNIIITYL